jgi:hypothetical protein
MRSVIASIIENLVASKRPSSPQNRRAAFLRKDRRNRYTSIFLIVLLASFLRSYPVWAAEQHYYDLGGACKDGVDLAQGINMQKIRDAEKSGSWDKVIEYEKLSVRGGCSNQFRWDELVESLLKAHREADALHALQEMDSRGFELNPSTIDEGHKELKKFMEAPVFKASSVGLKIEQLKSVSDVRRARFLESLKNLPSSEKPPENYIAKGACPFECCQYRHWTVEQDTDLVDSPDSHQVVGRAKKGSRVVGVTGEVHLKPVPVVVLFDQGKDIPKDTIVFALDYQGEGNGNVYTHGSIVSTTFGFADYCFRPSPACWAEYLLLQKEQREAVWWVQVKLPDGKSGWTDKAQHFGHKDACGG